MITINGLEYQTGNGCAITPKKLLRDLVRSGMVQGNIHKGKIYRSGHKLMAGELHDEREYLVMYQTLTTINPDVIMLNAYGEPVFFYQLSEKAQDK